MEIVTATVDLEEVRSYRSSKSRAMQAIQQPAYERIEVDTSLSKDSEEVDLLISTSPELEIKFHRPEEEIAFGPACWMWDYLRRSQQAGFFLPLVRSILQYIFLLVTKLVGRVAAPKHSVSVAQSLKLPELANQEF